MTQTSTYQMAVAGPKGMTAYSTELNSLLEAFLTKHAGASAPSTPYLYQDWFDQSGGTTVVPWKIFDGTDWIIIGTLDTTNNVFEIDIPDDYLDTDKIEDIGVGYIIIGDGSGNTVKLAPGANGTKLEIVSGVPSWQEATQYATTAEAIVFAVALG